MITTKSFSLTRDGFWGFPKGRIESNEELLAAAIREIREETGFTDIEFVKKLGTYERHPVISGVEEPKELKNITLFLFHTSEAIPASNKIIISVLGSRSKTRLISYLIQRIKSFL
jgi:8-oxo-dGTP pyrophosphatase MutT (NUDIX family)